MIRASILFYICFGTLSAVLYLQRFMHSGKVINLY